MSLTSTSFGYIDIDLLIHQMIALLLITITITNDYAKVTLVEGSSIPNKIMPIDCNGTNRAGKK